MPSILSKKIYAMNFMLKLISVIVMAFILQNSFSQQRKLPPGITTKTVPKGTILLLPTENSERFKVRIEINSDSANFELKELMYESGKYISENTYQEQIIHKYKVEKGDNIFFELVPDISDTVKMTLFIYFPSGMTAFRYMNCGNDQCIKYKRYHEPSDTNIHIVPLMIFYIDDIKSNKNEKLLNKYLSDGKIIFNSKKLDQLYKQLGRYKILFYYL